MLSIHLLGATEVQLGDTRLSINRRKSRALLYYVAAHAEPVSRSRLLALLWPDHTAQSARSNLRSTLYNLRQAMGDFLVTATNTVGLAGDGAPEIAVDVRAFGALATAAHPPSRSGAGPAAAYQTTARQMPSLPLAQLTELLALYRGEFLADFDPPDIPEFEEWVLLERERLRRLAIRGYEMLCRAYTEQQQFDAALAAIERALALDPFQEDLQRTALVLHYGAGDRAGAIRRFDEFRHLLDADMGVPPMAETQALYDAIVTDAPLPAAYADFIAAPAQQPGEGSLLVRGVRTETEPRPFEAKTPAPAHPETAHTETTHPETAHTEPTQAESTQSQSTQPQPTQPQSTQAGPPVTDASVSQPGSSAASFGPQPRSRTALNGGLRVPFIGRTEELDRLAEWLPDHRLIWVEGEPGLGKTSLIEQFLAERLTGNPLILTGRARELESRMPYQPVLEALRTLQREPDWPVLRSGMQLASLWQGEIARLVPELCPASAWENRTVDAAMPQDVDASRLWESVYQWLAALAQARPVVLFLDDLHWADPATLGMLGYLTRRMAGESAPVMFFAAGHPAATRAPAATLIQSLVREELIHRLTLAPLSAAEVTALARELSPFYGHPFGHWLYRSSEGSPFILVHLLRHAQETGLLSDDGTVDIHRLPSEPVVPQTVYTLIQSRLENLSESARRVLDAAVAVGREFDYEIAARASALSDTAALDALDELRRHRMIQNVDGERFAFDHTLTREVAYREVGEMRHRLLHRRVAAALESLYADRLDEFAGLLAHHYSEGNVPAQAYPFAVRAAQRAAAVAAWQPAIGFYQQALELMPAETAARERIGLLTDLGKAQLHAGEMQEATEVLHRAVDDSRAIRAAVVLREALQALAEALLNQARYQDVIDLAESIAAFIAEASDEQDTHEATEQGGEAEPGLDDPHLHFTVEFMWAAGLSVGGIDLATAAEHLRAAESRLLEASDTLSQVRLAQIAFELGSIDAQQGRLTDAVARYRRALELTAPKVNEYMTRWHILACNNLAYHLHLLHDPAAQECAHKGLELARAQGFLNMNGYLLSTLGEIALAQGNLDQAEDYFSQGLALAHRLTQPERIAGITANLGHVAVARGATEAAVRLFSQALELAQAIPNSYLTAQIRLWLARHLPPEQAQTHLDAAQNVIAAAGYGRLQAEWKALAQAINQDMNSAQDSA